jgi:hypothetical protein
MDALLNFGNLRLHDSPILIAELLHLFLVSLSVYPQFLRRLSYMGLHVVQLLQYHCCLILLISNRLSGLISQLNIVDYETGRVGD